MADIELVVKIPQEEYNLILKSDDSVFADCVSKECMMHSIKTGTPLPKGHGELIDRNLALSGDGLFEFHRYDDYLKMRNFLKSLPAIIEADKESEVNNG